MYLSLLQATAGLLFYLLKAQPIVTFYKLNVHAGELSLGRKVEGGELFQMSLNDSGSVLLRNQMEWHNSLLGIHMHVCMMMCCACTVVEYPFILCFQCLINHPLPPSFTALTPKDFSDFFQPVFKQGAHLKNKWGTKGSTVPKVTVCVHTLGLQTTHTHHTHATHTHTQHTHTHNTHTLSLIRWSREVHQRQGCLQASTYVCTYKLCTAKGATVCACLCVNHYCMLYALNAQE